MESSSDDTDSTWSISDGESAVEDTEESLQRELRLLKQGRHPKYLQRVKQLEWERDQRLEQADISRQHELKLSSREYERDLRAADEEFELEAQALKERLLDEAEAQRKRYEYEFRNDSLQLEDGELPPRSSRSTARKQKYRIERKANVSKLSLQLSDEEIYQDLLTIGAVRDARLVVEVSQDGTELLLHGQTFRLKQPVTIVGNQMQPIPGTIKHLLPNMVFIKHASEDRVLNMPLKHLRFGGIHIIPRDE